MSEDKYNGERVLCFHSCNYLDEGFVKVSEWDGMCTLFNILNGSFWQARVDAETNYYWKHIIPYVVLKDRDWVFAYERGSSSGESRLTSRVSIGIGGHVNPCDVSILSNPIQTYRNALMREIAEEISIKDISRDVSKYTPPIVGFISDNSNEVGRVHFGVVHIYDCANINVEPREDCIKNGKFYSKEKIMGEFGDRLEPWSRMILEAI
jgi:predicted NUDIX family phosphoesterase